MPTFTVTLSAREFEALAGLIDAGVRASGLRGAREAVAILDRLEAAARDVAAAPQEGEQNGQTHLSGMPPHA